MKNKKIMALVALCSVFCSASLCAMQAVPVRRITGNDAEFPMAQKIIEALNRKETSEEKMLAELRTRIPEGHGVLDLNFAIKKWEIMFNPLCLACKNGYGKIIDFLCERGADPNRVVVQEQRSNGNAFDLPLHIVLAHYPGDTALRKRLFAHGALPTIMLPNRCSLLYQTLFSPLSHYQTRELAILSREACLAVRDHALSFVPDFLLQSGVDFCSLDDAADCLAAAFANYKFCTQLSTTEKGHDGDESLLRLRILSLLKINHKHNHLFISHNSGLDRATSVLHRAIFENAKDIVSLLIWSMESTEIQRTIEETLKQPIHSASYEIMPSLIHIIAEDRYHDLWKILLPYLTPKMIRHADAQGITPLGYALRRGVQGGAVESPDVAEHTSRLRKKNDIEKIVLSIMQDDDVEALKMLISKGVIKIHEHIAIYPNKFFEETIVVHCTIFRAEQCLKYLLDPKGNIPFFRKRPCNGSY